MVDQDSEPANKLLVYTSAITTRLSYVLEIILPGAVLTNSMETFLNATGPRIAYSANKVSKDAFQIMPHGLLTEKGISQTDTDIFEWKGHKVFFATGGDLPFDIFAASFYLLSRYEEYLPHEKDAYGRYAHTSSIAYREGFLQKPLVNQWKKALCDILKSKYPQYTQTMPGFRFTPTYDIDIAFAYKHKPIWKNLAAFFHALLMGRFEEVMEMGNVFTGKKTDPFDVYEWLDTLHEKHQLKPVYFLLTLIKRGTNDKNLPAKSRLLQQLYSSIASHYACGLHPSWASSSESRLIEKEKTALEKIIRRKITLSRSHYLLFSLPQTYRQLMEAGIRDEYSMGYGSINGFRASMASPFPWYDLEREVITDLTLHPFCFMDTNAIFQQGLTAAQAYEELQFFYESVKTVNGECITIFHNHFLTEQPACQSWREMYASLLDKNC